MRESAGTAARSRSAASLCRRPRLGGAKLNHAAVTDSLVLGIIAFPGLCAYAWPGIILAILAVIFGGVAIGGMKRSGNVEGKGMAVAGLVLGLVVLALIALAVIFFIAIGLSFLPRGFR